MLSVQPVVNQIAFRVHKIEDLISVARVASSEDDHLVLPF